jgi:hypothetical protein
VIVSISQPRYLPWLGYFHRIATSDLFIYLDTVQYTPRDWENRNKVKTDRGWTWLTVPVKAAYRTLIPEVLIDNEQPWQHRHWKTILTFYSTAPHFHCYVERLRGIYEDRTWQSLTHLNVPLTGTLCECLGIAQARFAKASDIGAQGRGSELILSLCKAVGATAYLSGSQGRNYLDQAAFHKAGISLLYQDYKHPVYPQLYGAFQPNMAVIDLLFNCGPDSLDLLMSGQDSIRV